MTADAPAASLDAKIEAWHNGAGQGQELHEYLGMTWDEYKAWAGPKADAPAASEPEVKP